MKTQLPLPFPLREQFTLERFEAAGNPELVNAIMGLKRRPENFDCIWLWGESGSGKSHLLQAACHIAEHAAYLPAAAIEAADVDLDGYASIGVVGIDDVESWLGNRHAEEAVMHLYNAMLAARGVLLFAASRSPLACNFALADLASRVRAAECFEISVPDEPTRLGIFRRAARERGFELSDDVASYLFARVERGLPELLRVLELLDRESLAAQRRVTIPFVKAVLDL